MKEVGGYIEKQVAYLSGETSFSYYHSVKSSICFSLFDRNLSHPINNLLLSAVFPLRGSWGGLQCHHHPPRMLSFQWHSRGSFSQSIHIPNSHPSVRPLLSIPVWLNSVSFSAVHQNPSTCIQSTTDLNCSSAQCQMSSTCPPCPNLTLLREKESLYWFKFTTF